MHPDLLSVWVFQANARLPSHFRVHITVLESSVWKQSRLLGTALQILKVDGSLGLCSLILSVSRESEPNSLSVPRSQWAAATVVKVLHRWELPTEQECLSSSWISNRQNSLSLVFHVIAVLKTKKALLSHFFKRWWKNYPWLLPLSSLLLPSHSFSPDHGLELVVILRGKSAGTPHRLSLTF